MLSFADLSVVVITPAAGTDVRRNNPTLDYDSPAAVRTVVDGCVRLPGASPEVFGGRDTAGVVWTLLLPYGTTIDRNSAVEMDGGVRYAVDGEPLPWSSPTGAVEHVAAALRRFS